jgi:SynChlorMet cassette radical SAM/SPASM protein ScmF
MSLCDVPDHASEDKLPLDLPDGVPPLNALYLYLCTSCNLKCRHCWITPTYVEGTPSPGDVIDVDLLCEAVETAKPMGLSSGKLTGGEPMLHPRFMEIVDMLTDLGLELSMETNGTLLTRESARHLKKETNVHLISVSIDGADAKTHDAFRGVPGAFDAALRGLGYLTDAGHTNVQVIMCVHRGNLDQVDDLVKLASDRGAKTVKINPATKGGRGTAMHERGEVLDFDERSKLARYVYGQLHQKSPIRVIMNSAPALTPLPEIVRNGGCAGDCGVQGILGILGTGDIALCGIGKTVPDLVYGRLGEDSIRDIWLHHPRILDLRRKLKDPDVFPELCKACIHLRRCRTGCVAQNYLESGHLLWPDRICEEAARRNKFPETRKRPENAS